MRVVAVAALALALGAPPHGTARAGSADDSRPLPRIAHGQDAVDLLGGSIDRAAARNGWTAAQLRHVLETDSTAWLDRDGRVFYREPVAPASPDAAADEAPYPLDQTFLLHSRPGSTRTLLIDVDGATVSGTAWNAEFGLADGDHPAWTLDGDAATFNAAEREAIQSIWQRVAEDFASFDVDVTTEDPGGPVHGSRALVSPSAAAEGATCPLGCGGIAYIDVFGVAGDHYQPAWVFPHRLGNDTKSIAEAVSHEVGHNFGLMHDGTTVGQGPPCPGATEYYCGHAGWAPIMGAGYYRPITQWSRGEYDGASDTGQDDVALIAERAPYVLDEAGATPGTASSTLAGTKYVTGAGDQDVFRLGGCRGTLTATATPAPTSPNLDIRLDLLDASGGVVAGADPPSGAVGEDEASGLGATLTTELGRPGLYYLRVDGVGHGTGATGYTDYGSIGSYTLSAAGLTCGFDVPGAPRIGRAESGPTGGRKTVTFRWRAPANGGGVGRTGYTVQVRTKGGKVVRTVRVAAGRTSYTFRTTKDRRYRAVVTASNPLGAGPRSAPSRAVRAR